MEEGFDSQRRARYLARDGARHITPPNLTALLRPSAGPLIEVLIMSWPLCV